MILDFMQKSGHFFVGAEAALNPSGQKEKGRCFRRGNALKFLQRSPRLGRL
ncbi:MAG: hypothetical protein LC802_18205 [Acidobacteria bacterium]|nr:hypothetical protein [Acidobacteriota bacterium]